MIALSDSPEDMFGKVMRWTDGMIRSGFELCTRVEVLSDKHVKAEPMKYKKLLAFEVVKTFLGEAAAKHGQEYFASVIQENEKPTDIAEIKPSTYDVVTVLVESKLVLSSSEARRAIEQGGVKVDDTKVEDIALKVKKGSVVQKGKRFFVKVK